MGSKITRRGFIKLSSLGLASTVLAGCTNLARPVTLEPYVNAPENQVSGQATWYASTCRQCPAGCGILVRIMNGRAKKIEGNPEHPLNQGKLCARGQAGIQTLYDPDRLQFPVTQLERGSREFNAITWDEGLNRLYQQVKAAGARLAVWCGTTVSAHSYDLFERFTNAVGASGPLVYDLYGQASGRMSQAGISYPLGAADVVFSIHSDFLGTESSAVRYGVEYGQFRQQKSGQRGTLVVFEPRMTITGASADRWIPLKPGWEGAIALAMIKLIGEMALGSPERAERARQLAPNVDVNVVAANCEISRSELQTLARLFADADRPIAINGGAIHGHPQGALAQLAVEALNSVAGSTVFQDKAPDPSLGLPEKPAASSFTEVLDLITRMKSGEVQALLVIGANPKYDLPPQSGFSEALTQVPFVASFTPIVDETAAWADLILPDRTPLESWGLEITSPAFGQRILSSQQPVVQPLFDNYSSADIILTVARGIPETRAALVWDDEVAYLKDRVTASLAAAGLADNPEVTWARFLQHGGWWMEETNPGQSGATLQGLAPLDEPVYQGDENEYPFILAPYLSNLISDGRGANQTWLQGAPDPMTTMSWQTWVEINPKTANSLGVSDGDIVEVISEAGSISAPVYVYPAIRPDTIAVPFGQGHEDLGRFARERGTNPMKLIGTSLDETGRNLTWANVRVRVQPTGRRMALARLENPDGVSPGHSNPEHPG